VTTLRADLWTGFADGWKLYGRIDEPLVYVDDVTSSFNPNGHSRFGQGDLLTANRDHRAAADRTARLRPGRARRLADRRPERGRGRQVPDRIGRRRPLQLAGDQPRQLLPTAGHLSEQRRQPERQQGTRRHQSAEHSAEV
jgi:hypothetical protein